MVFIFLWVYREMQLLEEVDHLRDVWEDLDPGADHLGDLSEIQVFGQRFLQIGLGHLVESVRIHCLEVLAVHPAELLIVEYRRRLADPVVVKNLNQFLEAEDLSVAVRGPSAERDEVDDCLGKESLLGFSWRACGGPHR